MNRILIIGMTHIPGGVESFLLNYYRRLNEAELRFDFLSPSEEPVAYADELARDSRLYYVVPKKKDLFWHKRELEAFFREHQGEYCAVWANLNSLMNIDYLKCAKKYGVPTIIVHSHNSGNMGGILQRVLHSVNRWGIDRIATEYWACSDGAARWMFPQKLLGQVRIVKNAIATEQYHYDAEKRSLYRRKLGIEERKVIGHIGRLHFQKNQAFLLELLSHIRKKEPQYVLVLVGSGPEEAQLREKAKALGISECVYFAGQQTEIGGWLSAFDVFAFPSRFEGLSLVGLEAQANGLPVVAADTALGSESIVNSNVSVLSLQRPVEEWCSEIAKRTGTERIPEAAARRSFSTKKRMCSSAK